MDYLVLKKKQTLKIITILRVWSDLHRKLQWSRRESNSVFSLRGLLPNNALKIKSQEVCRPFKFCKDIALQTKF
jgi:hypothetical protein